MRGSRLISAFAADEALAQAVPCGMFGIGPTEAALLMVPLWLLPLFAAYWVIRLGVRHGAMDAHKRLQRGDGQIEPTTAPERRPDAPA